MKQEVEVGPPPARVLSPAHRGFSDVRNGLRERLPAVLIEPGAKFGLPVVTQDANFWQTVRGRHRVPLRGDRSAVVTKLLGDRECCHSLRFRRCGFCQRSIIGKQVIRSGGFLTLRRRGLFF